jgi:hypothetical protein
MDDINAKEAEHDRFRRIAFVAISIATASLFASVVGMPMIYGYVQELQSQINTEIGFCRVSICESGSKLISLVQISQSMDRSQCNSLGRRRSTIPTQC